MTTQVITITAAGGFIGLQRKAGQGLDLRKFGAAKIERASEIKWLEDEQHWCVHVMQGPYKGQDITMTDWCAVVGFSGPPAGLVTPPVRWGDMPMMFEDYDLAVKAEIAFLDALRAQGKAD